MKGRLEHELKLKEQINNYLKELPEYVTNYYYTIQFSKEPTTCHIYIFRIKHFLTVVGTDLTLIDSAKVGQYFESIKYVEKNGEIKTTSFSHRQLVWAVLNSFFSYLANENYISNNPMKNISRPRNKDVVERPALTMEDLNKILKSVKKSGKTKKQIRYRDRDFLMLYLFMYTGMRNTALGEINVEDFDLKKNTLTVIEKRNKTQVYTVSKELKKILKKWLVRRNEIVGTDTGPLFISETGNRMASKEIRLCVQRHSKEALGYEISPHKLRAAFVTLNYEANGHDIEATRRAVGHSSIETTSRYIVNKNNARQDALNYMTTNLKI